MENRRLLFTVSTVKESPATLRRFVRRNLRAGADHMFVFLDGDAEEALPFLEQHPHVTPVVTDERYWGGRRPKELIRRQLVNANLVNCLVSAMPSVAWLAHIDADECLDLDRRELFALPEDVRAVRLAVLESVSTEEPAGPETWFKRKLPQPQLEELAARGLIDAPHNRHYLFGHLIGKAVVRPGPDLDMGIHRAMLKGGTPVHHLRSQSFRVLHYDSVSLDAFVDKWVTHVHGGGQKFRQERRVVLESVRGVLLDETLDEEARQRRYRDIYREHVADPVDELLALGLLVQPPKARHRHRPLALTRAERRHVRLLLSHLERLPKSLYRDRGPADASTTALSSVRRQLWWHPRLQWQIRHALRVADRRRRSPADPRG